MVRRGHGKTGKYCVLRGSAVFVSEIAYPERPWKACSEMEDLLSLLVPEAPGEVLADLPVEGRLQRVLDAEGAALDEEEVSRMRGGDGQPGEGLDELGVVGRVDVAVGRLRQGGLEQPLAHLRVGHLRVVVADRHRREIREEVQQGPAAAGVEKVRAVALLYVHDDVVAVHEDVARERIEDVLGGEPGGGGHGYLRRPVEGGTGAL